MLRIAHLFSVTWHFFSIFSVWLHWLSVLDSSCISSNNPFLFYILERLTQTECLMVSPLPDPSVGPSVQTVEHKCALNSD